MYRDFNGMDMCSEEETIKCYERLQDRNQVAAEREGKSNNNLQYQDITGIRSMGVERCREKVKSWDVWMHVVEKAKTPKNL